MIAKIKRIAAGLMVTLAVVGLPVALSLSTPGHVSAAAAIGDCLSQGAGLDGTLGDTCTPTTSDAGDDLTDIITTIVNIVSVVVGVVAVIMIIWGGAKYITSGGESGKITSAKNTIIYALIGLVIVALAQVIVHFVLNKTSTIVT